MQIEDKFVVELCDVNSSGGAQGPISSCSTQWCIRIKSNNFQNGKKKKKKKTTHKQMEITAQTKPQGILSK